MPRTAGCTACRGNCQWQFGRNRLKSATKSGAEARKVLEEAADVAFARSVAQRSDDLHPVGDSVPHLLECVEKCVFHFVVRSFLFCGHRDLPSTIGKEGKLRGLQFPAFCAFALTYGPDHFVMRERARCRSSRKFVSR